MKGHLHSFFFKKKEKFVIIHITYEGSFVATSPSPGLHRTDCFEGVTYLGNLGQPLLRGGSMFGPFVSPA